MGEMYKAVCPKCGYKTKLCLGFGFVSINLERSASFLREDEQAAVMKIAAEGMISEFNIENKVTECAECRIIGSQMIIDIMENDKTKHRFGNLCSKCGKELTVREEGENGEYTCPKCGQGVLEMEMTGVWD